MKRLLLALLLLSCSPEPLGNGPRREVVREVAETVIVPTYAELAMRTTALLADTQAFVASPDPAGLERVRQAWRAARAPWMQAQAFGIGPVKDLVLDARMDQWPTSTEALDELLAGSEPIDTAAVRALGANKRGFHALEYLLFVDADRLLAEPRRRELLLGLADDLATNAADLHAAWDEGYLERFVDVGASDATYRNIKAAIDGLINQSVFLSEYITDTKLGRPLGLPSGGTARPELLESPSSDQSLADMASNLDGIDNVWRGSRDGSASLGLRSIVAARSKAVAAQVDSELASARAALAAVPRPLATALVDQREAVQAAWEAVRALRLTLTVDVVAVLGATLSFNDNDGD